MNFFQSFPAVSPDGRLVAFTAANPLTGRLSVWVRALDSPELREIPDTDQAANLFWSADSRSLGFFARDKLKRVSIAAGSAQVICDSPIGAGGAWNQAGTILFSRGHDGAIYQVPATGGMPAPVTSLEPERHAGHWFPSWLPGGRQFLFTALGSQPECQGVYTASLDSKRVNRLLPVMTNVRYAPPGYLLFLQGAKVVAQRFDVGRLRLEGEPFAVADGVWGVQGLGAFDVSDSGVLSFAEAELPSNQLMWFDRSGKALGTAGAAGPFIHMDLSRDERRVLLERWEGMRGDLWILDLERNVPTRLTYGPGWAFQGYWSPDGTRVVYSLGSETSQALYVRDAGGTGQERQLLKLAKVGLGAPTDWSRDGRYVVYSLPDSKNACDLWVLPLSPELAGGDLKPVPYLRSPFMKTQGRVSPDGRWMAYVSTESQTPEVYVSPFPNATAKWRISTASGTQPRWRADGKELFYLTLEHTLMAVPVRAASNFQAGADVPLFRARPAEYYQGSRYDYAPSRDGRKFLVNTRLGVAGSRGIQVMVGWQPVAGR
jgi:Tol biopolymer transport system component